MEKTMRIGLFDPGMTYMHRVGLAGLYMTIARMQSVSIRNAPDVSECILEKDSVTLKWQGDDRNFFDSLFKASFGIEKGIISFAAHHGQNIGDIEKNQINNCILTSFLQHGGTRKLSQTKETLSFMIDDKNVEMEMKLVEEYNNRDAAKCLFTEKGKLKDESPELVGWIYPGAAVRHQAHQDATKMFAKTEHFICLLYAAVASLYYKLKHYDKNGSFDEKMGTAIVFPFIEDLKEYSRCYTEYLNKKVEDLYADSLCDAGLQALITLRAALRLKKSDMEVDGCTVLTMGTLGWSKQQKSRTGIFTIENVDERMLTLFEIVWSSLKNKKQVQEQKKGKKVTGKYYLSVYPSLSRGLFAGNIAAGKDWFLGFSGLMCSRELAAKISFEKGGLTEMMKNKEIWSDENNRFFVEAVHIAIRNRYGALAGQASSRGEKPRFDREFTKMRTSLMRAKNQPTLRQEIADIFARGGINKSLQQKWNELLPLFISGDWQKTRDLALFALASYAGKGADEVENSLEKKEV